MMKIALVGYDALLFRAVYVVDSVFLDIWQLPTLNEKHALFLVPASAL